MRYKLNLSDFIGSFAGLNTTKVTCLRRAGRAGQSELAGNGSRLAQANDGHTVAIAGVPEEKSRGRELRCSAVEMAGTLGGLHFAAREGHGFKNALVAHGRLDVGLPGSDFWVGGGRLGLLVRGINHLDSSVGWICSFWCYRTKVQARSGSRLRGLNGAPCGFFGKFCRRQDHGSHRQEAVQALCDCVGRDPGDGRAPRGTKGNDSGLNWDGRSRARPRDRGMGETKAIF